MKGFTACPGMWLSLGWSRPDTRLHAQLPSSLRSCPLWLPWFAPCCTQGPVWPRPAPFPLKASGLGVTRARDDSRWAADRVGLASTVPRVRPLPQVPADVLTVSSPPGVPSPRDRGWGRPCRIALGVQFPLECHRIPQGSGKKQGNSFLESCEPHVPMAPGSQGSVSISDLVRAGHGAC